MNIDIIDYKVEVSDWLSIRDHTEYSVDRPYICTQGEEICIKQTIDKSNKVINYSFSVRKPKVFSVENYGADPNGVLDSGPVMRAGLNINCPSL
jgi:hypothetical protein